MGRYKVSFVIDTESDMLDTRRGLEILLGMLKEDVTDLRVYVTSDMIQQELFNEVRRLTEAA